jgi:hypothetical protein
MGGGALEVREPFPKTHIVLVINIAETTPLVAIDNHSCNFI